MGNFKNKKNLIRSLKQSVCRFLYLLPVIALFGLVRLSVWQSPAHVQDAGAEQTSRSLSIDNPKVTAAVQPAILAASGASRGAVTFLDPETSPASQVLVSGLPPNANPQGVAYYGSDNGLLADAGNFRILVIQASTGAVLSTIDTTAVGFNGSGTIAVSPDQTIALAMGSVLTTPSTSLYVVHAPFTSSSAITPVTLPGALGSFQTEAIVFNSAGRAFVYNTAGISVLDAPYTSVAFTIPFSNGSGAIAISPNGNTLLITNLTLAVGVIQGPFSAASIVTSLQIFAANALDGIAIAPDGASAIVVDNGGHAAFGIASPFSSNSTVSNIPLPAGVEQFEDVGISADSQLAILAGGSINEPAVFVRAPFNTSAVTTNVPLVGVANTSRGRGSVRFRPSAAAPMVSVGGRVFTSDGRGLRNATVTITDANGVATPTTTSSFGFYSFTGVTAGQTYTIRVFSRFFRFQPRTLMVTVDVSNVDFNGLE